MSTLKILMCAMLMSAGCFLEQTPSSGMTNYAWSPDQTTPEGAQVALNGYVPNDPQTSCLNILDVNGQATRVMVKDVNAEAVFADGATVSFDYCEPEGYVPDDLKTCVETTDSSGQTTRLIVTDGAVEAVFADGATVSFDYCEPEDLKAYLEAVDSVMDKLEACLAPLDNIIPLQQHGRVTHIDRTQVKVLVAPDWYISPCTGAQLFSCDLGDHGNNPACPIECAGTIQGHAAVVTPNLGALAHEEVHLLTGQPDPFKGEVQKCADGIRPEQSWNALTETETEAANQSFQEYSE